ncbi:hypothetical protein [Prescottella equi]|uniref:hypothetical protein n=1 Tax=Rhodococcus hoagii TaxID=43767 RepID=UPI00384FA64F
MIESARPTAQRTREGRAFIAAAIVALMALTQLKVEAEMRLWVLGVQSVIGLAAFAFYFQNERAEARKKTAMQILFVVAVGAMMASARGLSMILA